MRRRHPASPLPVDEALELAGPAPLGGSGDLYVVLAQATDPAFDRPVPDHVQRLAMKPSPVGGPQAVPQLDGPLGSVLRLLDGNPGQLPGGRRPGARREAEHVEVHEGRPLDRLQGSLEVVRRLPREPDHDIPGEGQVRADGPGARHRPLEGGQVVATPHPGQDTV